MKKSKLLIVGIFFAFSFLAYTPAHAATTTTSSQSSGIFSGLSDFLNSLFGGSSSSSKTGSGSTSTGSGSGSSSLPINGNLWFLVIAGAAVGCKVIVNNNKTLAPQKA